MKDNRTLNLFEPAPPPEPVEKNPRICGMWIGWSHVKENFGLRFTWRASEKILCEPTPFEELPLELQQKILAEQENDFVDLAEISSAQGPVDDELPKCFCGKGVRMWIQTATVEGGFCSEECYERQKAL